MRKIILGLIFLQVTAAFAKGGGVAGNGGELSEIEWINAGYKIAEFLKTEEGKLAFPNVDAQKFQAIVEETIVKASDPEIDGELLDYRGKQRSALNFYFEGKTGITFNQPLLLKYETKPDEQLVLVMHEYLNLLGIEKTTDWVEDVNKPSSVYTVSQKITPYYEKVFGYQLDRFGSGQFSRITCTDIFRPFGYRLKIAGDGYLEFKRQMYWPVGHSYRHITIKNFYKGYPVGVKYKNKNMAEFFFRDKKFYYTFKLAYLGADEVGLGYLQYGKSDFRDEPEFWRHQKVRNSLNMSCFFIEEKK